MPHFRCRPFSRARALLLLLLLLRGVLVRKVRGRAAVLDRAGKLDRRLQHPRGLLRLLRALNLRECGSTSVDSCSWWAGVCVPVLDVAVV